MLRFSGRERRSVENYVDKETAEGNSEKRDGSSDQIKNYSFNIKSLDVIIFCLVSKSVAIANACKCGIMKCNAAVLNEC